jgi:DNA-binding LytR/AlgR family response regulator
MNILAIDDNILALEDLVSAVKEACPHDEVNSFSKPSELLDFAKETVCGIAFLDIEIWGMNGIELARKLKEIHGKTNIVFVTGHSKYALDSYTVKASDYIMKPVTKEAVKQALENLRSSVRIKYDKIEKTLEAADTAGIPVKTKQITRFILFRDISHVEVIRHNVHFRLTDGDEVQITGVFSKIIPKLLADKRFAECHRSFVVNMDAISSIQGNIIIMNDGKNVPISKKYSVFKKLYSSRLFGYL